MRQGDLPDRGGGQAAVDAERRCLLRRRLGLHLARLEVYDGLCVDLGWRSRSCCGCGLSDPAWLPSLSTGECELRALSRAASEAKHPQNILEEMSCPGISSRLFSEANAALQNTQKLGPGRV